ncbi:hydrogenase expression/formation protein HypE [Clostridium sp.]|jgi:hydrogenase expression/formation protein HypE|uniref:hydrogenase expression/formation protein HypE n=2 Tax=Clostridium TaxID=1485 RepID=UPI0025BA0A8E|nr:hydrogenase expression/formation protein HypE [Clostridium sp.]MCI9070007.1 hydrogenase expression/formation protein HypE [Clostridium sp.]
MDIITLSHGSGGQATNKLIDNLFYKYFNNEFLSQKNDSSVLPVINGKIAMSTDSFVINPIFFEGGDIGKLAICGTINDICMSGAKPLYISVGFIIEEGLSIKELERIVKSMSKTVKEAGVKIVTGDTKVVERGNCEKIYINTTGIGIIKENNNYLSGNKVKDGDVIIISGTLGDHGMCIMNERENLGFDINIKSDCCLLNKLIEDILSVSNNVRVLRDPTRGGLATTLNEIVEHSKISMEIKEEFIKVKPEVSAMCEILGMDPLFIANEGKVVVIVDEKDADNVLKVMKNNKVGRDSIILGKAIDDGKNKLYLKTNIGGRRIINMPEGEILVRIC